MSWPASSGPTQPYHDLTGTWEKINASLLADEDFGGRLGRIGFLKDQLQALAANTPSWPPAPPPCASW